MTKRIAKKTRDMLIEAASPMWGYIYPKMDIDVHCFGIIYKVTKVINEDESVSYEVTVCQS
jgi:hypothetical protein